MHLPPDDQQGSRLMTLADELILSIIEQIEDIQTLRDFALTCQKAQARAEPYLYRNLYFYDGEAVLRFQGALASKLDRGRHVEYLAVRYKAETRPNIDLLNNMLDDMHNLREWHIESPCPNDSLAFSLSGSLGEGEGVLRYWENVSKFHHLQSIHIHTHILGKTYFDLCDGQGAIIFKHPSLRSIHLACTDVTAESVRLLKHCTDKTPLESLTFEECNISSEALKVILSQPKALKRITLGERLHHFHTPTSRYLPEAGEGLAQALALQAASLEYLKQTQQISRVLLHWNGLDAPERRRVFCLPADLPTFPNHTELDIPYGSPLQTLTSRSPKLRKVRIHNFHEHLPVLGLEALTRELNLLNPTSIKHLELILMEVRTVREHTEEEFLDCLLGPTSTKCIFYTTQKRDLIWDFGQKLRKNDIRLTVNWVRSAGYIPPYMHGEILPTEFTIYDSDSPNNFGHEPSGNVLRDTECEARLKIVLPQGGLISQHAPYSESDGDEGEGEGEDEDDDEAYAFM